MPVWSVVIALSLLLGFAIRSALFGAPRVAPGEGVGRVARLLGLYVLLLCALNFLSVVVQCGIGQCHTTGYRLLGVAGP